MPTTVRRARRAVRRALASTLGTGVLVASIVVTGAAGAGVVGTRAGWSLQHVVNPKGARADTLSSVTCVTPSWCQAVGTAGLASYVTLAELWDGSAWTAESSRNAAGSRVDYLYGVACASETRCVAVGEYNDSKGYAKTLGERLVGRTWVLTTTPNPRSADFTYLNAVACTKTFACMAVGYASTPKGTNFAVTERWNGSRWSLVSAPAPAGATASSFGGVSCVAATACLAAGHSTSRSGTTTTLVERWNGTRWTIVPTPNAPSTSGSLLRDIACTSSRACEAVGNANGTSSSVTLAMRWNGTSWTIVRTPDPTGEAYSYLESVWCRAPTSCVAVGDATSGGTKGSSLAERLTGSHWTIDPTPTTRGATFSDLRWLSCAAPRCEAVGSYENRVETGFPLAEGAAS